LPKSLKIHSLIHISNFEPCYEEKKKKKKKKKKKLRYKKPEPPFIVNEEEEYEIEMIWDKRKHY